MMKTKSTWAIAGLCTLLASAMAAENRSTAGRESASGRQPASSSPATGSIAAPEPANTSEKKAGPAASKPDSTVPPGSELATSQVLEEANAEHIKESRTFQIVETPPPPPREEKKPPSPTSGLVWVPGHWIPVKGEWQWRAGEWCFPATPVSVWIDSKYDPKSKRWTAGYWQPDKPSPEPVSSHKDHTTSQTQKFF